MMTHMMSETVPQTEKEKREALKTLLKAFGFDLREKDERLLDWALKRAESYAICEINAEADSEEVFLAIPDLAAGNFLKAKKAVEPDFFVGLSLTPALKRIELGDTKTEFSLDGSLTPEQRLDALIEYLLKRSKSQLARYRRIRW